MKATLANAPFMSTLIELAPDYIVRIDLQGKVLFVNRLPEGLEFESVLGQSWIDFISPPFQKLAEESFHRVITKGDYVDYEAMGTGDHHGEVWYAIRLAPIWEDGRIEGCILIARNIEEKKLAESQLIAAERLAAVGAMVAGVAHEINNPLGAIFLNLEMILQELEDIEANGAKEKTAPERLKERLTDTHTAVDRIKKIVDDLKIFSHKEEDELSAVNIENLIDSTIRISWSELKYKAKIIKNYTNIPDIIGSEARLGQVMLNLIINAAQSMKAEKSSQNEIIISTSVNKKNQAVITIRDTGIGIPPANAKKIFSPFFTTKPKGIGTGLGLSISKRIINSFNGEITFDSVVGEGTEFKILLPLVEIQPAEYVNPSVLPNESEAKDSQRSQVLIVDDEITFSTVLEEVLADDNEVTTAESGIEALRLLAEGRRYNVIISDIMMPEMSGIEFYYKVLAQHPSQAERMVFMTGAAFTHEMRSFLDSVENKKIEKPFKLKELRKLMTSIKKK